MTAVTLSPWTCGMPKDVLVKLYLPCNIVYLFMFLQAAFALDTDRAHSPWARHFRGGRDIHVGSAFAAPGMDAIRGSRAHAALDERIMLHSCCLAA